MTRRLAGVSFISFEEGGRGGMLGQVAHGFRQKVKMLSKIFGRAVRVHGAKPAGAVVVGKHGTDGPMEDAEALGDQFRNVIGPTGERLSTIITNSWCRGRR